MAFFDQFVDSREDSLYTFVINFYKYITKVGRGNIWTN